MGWAKFPLLLHAAIETAAAISFIANSTAQLPGASDDAVLILRSYGGLLLSSNLLCFLFAARPGFDAATALVAVSVGSYHLWPAGRALARIRRGIGTEGDQGRVLGGPALHLVVHVVCFVALMGAALFGVESA